MLTNATKGTRVVLANGLKATVVTNDGLTATIKADGGKYRTRSYNMNGYTTDGENFDVVAVINQRPEEVLALISARAEKLTEDLLTLVGDVVAISEDAETPTTETLTSYDFGDGAGPVPAHRHMNPEGDEGGIVANTATVSADSRVGRGSLVYGTAQVSGGSKVINNSRVSGNARISGMRIDGMIIGGGSFSHIAA